MWEQSSLSRLGQLIRARMPRKLQCCACEKSLGCNIVKNLMWLNVSTPSPACFSVRISVCCSFSLSLSTPLSLLLHLYPFSYRSIYVPTHLPSSFTNLAVNVRCHWLIWSIYSIDQTNPFNLPNIVLIDLIMYQFCVTCPSLHVFAYHIPAIYQIAYWIIFLCVCVASSRPFHPCIYLSN